MNYVLLKEWGAHYFWISREIKKIDLNLENISGDFIGTRLRVSKTSSKYLYCYYVMGLFRLPAYIIFREYYPP